MQKTLFLTSQDIKEIIDMDMVIKAVEDAFRLQGRGKTIMPPKIYLHLDEYNGDFRAMPAYVNESAGLKWVNVHPNNPAGQNLPTVMATIIYSDPGTGFPLAIMDGTLITNYRTGASGAVASKYLAGKDSRSLGLIGSGAQAQSQLDAVRRVFGLNEVCVYSKNLSSANAFVEKNTRHGARTTSLEEAAGCDIVCTTTPVREPIVYRTMIKEGTHINAIGADAPGKEELDPLILKEAKVVVDDIRQAVHSGEINVPVSKGFFAPEDISATLGEVVAGFKRIRTGNEITVFDSTGLAIQDIATAKIVYEQAKQRGIGCELEMIEAG